MPVILNKIDPVIVNNIHQTTVEGVVHPQENIRVSKDKKENKGGGHSNKKGREKVDKFNSILEVMGLELHFIVGDEGIAAVDKYGNVIKRYTEDAVIELFNKMEDMIGIFVDTRK